MKQIKDYEPVMGLEVHVELKTASKLFCSCSTLYGQEPNTACCPVCSGQPGALPTVNRKAVEFAIRAGLALHCTIDSVLKFDRKNYFYPDLPKGYQISQNDRPLCKNGYLDIQGGRIRIERIHLEEDAGKLLHLENGTYIDYNRSGVPLIEIVTAPDFRSPAQARAFLTKLKSILLATGISDCKMNEGSLRCDVNLSVHEKGTPLGVRNEIKNLNSFHFVEKAASYEYERQKALLEEGKTVRQMTVRFDEQTGKTYPMRPKEDLSEYRFIKEPDLPLYSIDKTLVSEIQKSLPMLPDEQAKHLQDQYRLSSYDAEQLSENPEKCRIFEEAAKYTEEQKILCNLLLSSEEEKIRAKDWQLGQIVSLLSEEKISFASAKELALLQSENDVLTLAEERGFLQINGEKELLLYVRSAISENPKIVEDYRNGKKNAPKALIGKVMEKTFGRGNPKMASFLIYRELDASLDK